ncbi:hypothetical protein Hanom_Chr06g00563371 [Helianthus anomalus]
MILDHAYPDLGKDENTDLLALNHMDNETLIVLSRNDVEMKENSAADELIKMEEFKETRNNWFLKEDKKKRSRKTTPKVQAGEGSSSQPQKKRKKKAVETMLVDEPEEDETEVDVNINEERLSFETKQLLKTLHDTI